ncbi:unnamed protein product [Phytomonas sp. Hart1]|nr:unnamed protein product [Phytomonas sp. Hart1]|eukprot:CCW71093.1 unnamed protein product [Phytomonas sp. isolate Hart1]
MIKGSSRVSVPDPHPQLPTQTVGSPHLSPRTDVRPFTLKESRFAYLQALCPYATPAQLYSALCGTTNVEKAARWVYDAHRPDITSLRWMTEWWDAKRNSAAKADPSQCVDSFEGVDLLLTQRAREACHKECFSHLSSTREYNYTVRVLPVDTSGWDKQVLLAPRSLQDAVHQRLSLSNEEQTTETRSARSANEEFSPRTSRSRYQNSQKDAKGLSKKKAYRMGGREIAPIIRWLSEFPDMDFSASNLPIQRTEAESLDSFLSLKNFFRTCPLNMDNLRIHKDPYKDYEKCGMVEAPDLLHPMISNRFRYSDNAEGNPVRFLSPFSREEGMSHRNENLTSTMSKDDESSEPFAMRLSKKKQANDDLFTKSQLASPKSEDWRGNYHCNYTQSEINQKTQPSRNIPVIEVKSGIFHPTPNKNEVFPMTQREREEIDTLDAIISKGSENIMYFIEEEKRWKLITSLLVNFSNMFSSGNSCNLIKEVYSCCPLFVKQVDDILKASMEFLNKEALGWQLASPLDEISVRVPLIGRKLLSTSEFQIKELEIDPNKCSCEFIDDGMRVKVRIFIKKLFLHPVQFAFIGESDADRQKRCLRNSTQCHRPGVYTYTKGVTNGELSVKVRRVKVKLYAKVMIAFRENPELRIEESSVSIKSLKLSSNVFKLNLLYTFFKPCIMSIVEKGLCDALVRSNRL